MEFLKNHFEKLLLSVFLVALMGVAIFLAIKIGLLKSSDLSIQKGKQVKPLDETVLEEVARKAEVPPRWSQPRRLFVSPVLAFMAEPGTGRMVLGPPDQVPRAAEDVDIPDPEWLKKHGLPNVAGIGREDTDKDGFTNKEEYDYKTNPKEAESFPSLEAYLILESLDRKEFQLRFKGKAISGDNSLAFQVNIRALDYTYFNRLGEQIGDARKKEPYKIEKFEEAFEEYFDASLNAKRQRDVSRLTLRRMDDNSEVVLVLDQIAIEKTLGATLRNKLAKAGERASFSVTKNEEIKVHGKNYKVVDITDDGVLISDPQAQQQYTLKKSQ